MKYVLSILSLGLISYIAYASLTEADQSLLDKTIEYNNWIYTDCFWWGASGYSWAIPDAFNTSWSNLKTDTERYRVSTDCWKSQRKLTPDDLFLTVPKYLVDEGRCSISQSEDKHSIPSPQCVEKFGEAACGMFATDLACNFEAQGVYAPDYLDQMIEYKIESVWYDNLLWNFVILSFPDTDGGSFTRWYFGHTVLDAKWKVGDTVQTWVRFAHANISGATTGWHTHIELRRMYDGVWQSVRYVTRWKERKLEEKRLWSGSWQGWNNTIRSESTGALVYYFTHYAFVESQTDGAPCISASGDDVCKLKAHGRWTMALTVDIRKKLGVNFGDKVALTGDVGCEGVYTITDEMACRFRGEHAWSNGPCTYSDGTPTQRTSNIRRPWTNYFIKWDLPGRPGGACSIKKL
mgnify:CR=1 FL=1